MNKWMKRWTGLLLSVLLLFSAAAGAAFAEAEKDEAQDLFDLAWDTYVTGDYASAAEYFRRSAELGHPEAGTYLGVMYINGIGVEPSMETALEYFREAADRGNADAVVNLGCMYYQGLGVEQSYETAVEYFSRGVEMGSAPAMDWLGSMYRDGDGVEQSYEKALEYFRMSADLGEAEGLIFVGLCYKRGEGVPQDYEKAREYFILGADQDDDPVRKSIALYNLGSLYEDGLGAEQSYEQAAEYYRQAADLDHPLAQDSLGIFYELGCGVEQSYEKAAEFYRLAADQAEAQQFPDGLVHLARLYQEGLGVERSAETAAELLARAAALGSDEAQQELQALSETNDYGLMPTGGIVIPEFTADTVRTFDIPENEAMAFTGNLTVGWNLGNTFDARDDGPGVKSRDYETYWSGAKTTRELIHAVRQAGFSLIRIPVSWHNHLDSDWTIDPAWLSRVEEVAGWALDEGLYVIINIHHDNEKGYLYPDSDHYDQSERYIGTIWRQVAEKFAGYDERVIFESMNEPRLVGTQVEWVPNPGIPEVLDAMQCINRLNQVFVDTVRASGGNNASRWLMVPGYSGSVDGAAADAFTLPEDSRLIVEVHAYTPYPYALDTSSPDSSFDLETDKAKMNEITGFMDRLYRKFVANGVPVIIDEFGALKKNDGDLQGRVNFTAFYTAQARARGIPVVWWDNANYTGRGEKFALIDRNKLQWVFPDIALALVRNCAPAKEE